MYFSNVRDPNTRQGWYKFYSHSSSWLQFQVTWLSHNVSGLTWAGVDIKKIELKCALTTNQAFIKLHAGNFHFHNFRYVSECDPHSREKKVICTTWWCASKVQSRNHYRTVTFATGAPKYSILELSARGYAANTPPVGTFVSMIRAPPCQSPPLD